VPIALGVIALGVALSGLLPHQGDLPLLALLAWDAGGIWMIVERRRRKVKIPIPTTMVVGLISLGALVLVGCIMAWMGIDRLASPGGPALVVIGGFLLLLAMFAPAFRMLDAALRFAGRSLTGHRRPHRPPARTRRPAQRQRRPAA
jgi:hypothetical protein